MQRHKFTRQALACSITLLCGPAFCALVIEDNLNGVASRFDWQSINGACLTAGNNTGSIPACVGLPYYAGKTLVGGAKDSGRLPDTVGSGALRLSNGAAGTGTNGNNQTGAVYSKFSFPSNAGVDITFKTVTYGGNAYVNHAGYKSGADGIVFFLADADKASVVDRSTEVGAFGGSLGYSCGNAKTVNDGLYGAYIGLGIDEFGNFSNPGDNTHTGPGQGQNRVTLRGAGDTNWEWLNANHPRYYPSSLSSANQQNAVKITCSTGFLHDYSNPSSVKKKEKLAYNYNYIAHENLSNDKPIYNQQGIDKPTRTKANPITYGLKITQDGLLSLSYSYNGGIETPIITQQSISASNGPLPRAFRFGFAAGTGGGSNVHEIMCFKAEQITVSASSAGANTPQSGRVQVGSQLYLASYFPKNWWGQLTANDVLVDDDTGMVTLSNKANWDGNCTLTGGSCSATGTNVTAQAPAQRRLLTWNGEGKLLSWSNLSTAQKTALDVEAEKSNAGSSAVLDYLQGGRSQEVTTAGTGRFRLRDSVLGDIVNSSPVWVGKPLASYTGTFKDALFASARAPEGTSYADYVKAKAQRPHVVYVGANDGFVHGFRAGRFSANGDFDKTNNDGREVLAYMPSQVLETINPSDNANLRFSSTTYAHNAMVDATPATGDLYYGGAWHTWLVGGLGAGGNKTGVIADNTSIATGAIYALDVSNPQDFQNASPTGIVLGEWSSKSLVCVGDTPAEKCADHLGSTYGTPLIRRLHNGHWAVLFGNGLNSKTGKAGIFVMIVDQDTGARTFRYINAGQPAQSANAITARNGITQLVSADLDLDHVTDYVYAGDMLGNLWRFDLTASRESSWQARPTPLFKTGGRPITTAPTVTSSKSGADYRVIVSFGTGKVYPQTLNSSSYVVPGSQFLLGIWDYDLAAWNDKSGVKYKTLSSEKAVDYADLQEQTITETTLANAAVGYNRVRSVSQNRVCWQGSDLCPTANNKYGWKIELPSTNEQVIYNPTISDGMFVVNTTIPEVTQVLSCTAQSSAGFTMAILPDTGAAPARSYFKGVLVSSGIVAGLGLGGVGSTSSLSSSRKDFIVTNTTEGKAKIAEIDKTLNITTKRLTWIQRR